MYEIVQKLYLKTNLFYNFSSKDQLSSLKKIIYCDKVIFSQKDPK